MITESLTGHMHYGSPYHSDDDCGTCNGARCDCCKKIYVTDDQERFDSEDDANEHEAEIQKLYGLGFSVTGTGFTIIDGELHVQTYVFSNDAEKYGVKRGDQYVKCNKESSLYEDIFITTKLLSDKFNNCKCIDKHEEYYGNSCDVLKACTNSGCYARMIAGAKERSY